MDVTHQVTRKKLTSAAKWLALATIGASDKCIITRCSSGKNSKAISALIKELPQSIKTMTPASL